MNDFTKEELQYIFYCTDIVTNRNDEHDLHAKLLNKISFMIDNYCSHQERVSSSDEDGHMIVQCGRCDSVLWHEKD